MLEVIDLAAGYNGLPVVRDVNITVSGGEIVALLGANGAGKTTILSTIAGLVKPIEGSVRLAGEEISGLKPHKLALQGIALVPEDRSLFLDLTTRENLTVAAPRGAVRKSEDDILQLLPELKKCLNRKAGLLSGGEQQMLAVGRALVGSPQVLIVDEMSLGLAPVVVERLLPVLRDVASTLGAAVLVVEQHVSLALDVAARAYVLAHGRIVLEGAAAALRKDQDLIAASYFGDLAAEEQLSADRTDDDDIEATS
ncbi:ABC transporter ATP-binding protein [uncultured Microbacterium sp.]|uniref:ABC transporter ATP-binding protein n=1 Tax=uncultured Microbacterium sp. TaxID=191216 RepID=UPI0028D15069|nr:ABC transporter ATP-binding protein [uncultured Microbacterium sp.]